MNLGCSKGLSKGVFFPSEIGLATGAEMNNETFKEWIVKNSHGIELNLGLLWMPQQTVLLDSKRTLDL